MYRDNSAPEKGAENFVLHARSEPPSREKSEIFGEVGFEASRSYRGDELNAFFDDLQIVWPDDRPVSLPSGMTLILSGGGS